MILVNSQILHSFLLFRISAKSQSAENTIKLGPRGIEEMKGLNYDISYLHLLFIEKIATKWCSRRYGVKVYF